MKRTMQWRGILLAALAGGYATAASANGSTWMIYDGLTHLDSMRCDSCPGGENYSPHDPQSWAYQIDVTHTLGTSSGGYPYGLAAGYLDLGSVDSKKTDGVYALYHVSGGTTGFRWTGGAGPYLYAVTEQGTGGYVNVYRAGFLMQAGVAYSRSTDGLEGRLVWERLTTFDSFDQDVFLAGLGKRF